MAHLAHLAVLLALWTVRGTAYCDPLLDTCAAEHETDASVLLHFSDQFRKAALAKAPLAAMLCTDNWNPGWEPWEYRAKNCTVGNACGCCFAQESCRLSLTEKEWCETDRSKKQCRGTCSKAGLLSCEAPPVATLCKDDWNPRWTAEEYLAKNCTVGDACGCCFADEPCRLSLTAKEWCETAWSKKHCGETCSDAGFFNCEAHTPTPVTTPANSTLTNLFTGRVDGGRNDFSGEVGFQFKATKSITVTRLGRGTPTSDGVLASTVAVNLWNVATSTLLATVSVGPASTLDDGYRYATLATPIQLEAGQLYRLTQACTSGMSDKWNDGFSNAAFVDGVVSDIEGVYSWVRGAYPEKFDGKCRRTGMVTFSWSEHVTPSEVKYVRVPSTGSTTCFSIQTAWQYLTL